MDDLEYGGVQKQVPESAEIPFQRGDIEDTDQDIFTGSRATNRDLDDLQNGIIGTFTDELSVEGKPWIKGKPLLEAFQEGVQPAAVA